MYFVSRSQVDPRLINVVVRAYSADLDMFGYSAQDYFRRLGMEV